MKYDIKGGNFPVVELSLSPGEKVYCETGAMSWITDGIDMQTSNKGGVFKGLGRALSGESFFLNTYTSTKEGDIAAFSSQVPGDIVPIDVEKTPVVAQKSVFLVAENSVQHKINFRKKLRTGFFGGEGFIMQKFYGEGLAFFETDGSVIQKELAPGERLRIDTGNVAMFETSVKMDTTMVKGFSNMLFGGEGLFLTTLTGPGKVWLQTMPISGLASSIIPFIPTDNSK
ncbi:TIGR00266 family protein [Proteinivorax tanatarense]|uniref:TIGR00266 family protein n=1 Tax=Proteinivorax tanatarense TaxID=1260629 RepID=A0AAU7VNK6_9FIRM